MKDTICFLRIHLTEEASRALARVDVDAFRLAFPAAIQSVEEHILSERYADYGLVGCLVQIKIAADDETQAKIDEWLERLNNVAYIGNQIVH